MRKLGFRIKEAARRLWIAVGMDVQATDIISRLYEELSFPKGYDVTNDGSFVTASSLRSWCELHFHDWMRDLNGKVIGFKLRYDCQVVLTPDRTQGFLYSNGLSQTDIRRVAKQFEKKVRELG